MKANCKAEEIGERLSEVAPTHWKSRLFTVALDPSLLVGFWESEDALHGRPSRCRGRSVGGWNAVCDCGGALERGDHRAAAAGRAGRAAALGRGQGRDSDCARTGRVGDPRGGAHAGGVEDGGCDHHAGLPAARRDGALRGDLHGGCARHRPVAAGDGRAAQLRRADLRDAGTGAGPRRSEGGEQGI